MKIKTLQSWQLGVGLCAGALLIEKFLPSNNGFDFIAGFLFGLSIVINISSIIHRRKSTVIS